MYVLKIMFCPSRPAIIKVVAHAYHYSLAQCVVTLLKVKFKRELYYFYLISCC